MRAVQYFALLTAAFAELGVAQQPVITGVLNNYGFVQPSEPNYGIARGAIFDIFGFNLASNPTTLQPLPLPTNLNGVSASVTSHGVTIPLILYFVSPTQIDALLPSTTPEGTAQLTVTNSNTAIPVSASFPIQVVTSAFGILTLNVQGNGPAAVFDSSSRYLTVTNSANPGEYITIWGTGLGPVDADETKLQTPQDLVKVPIEVDIGGVPATVTYHGRSAYPGLDQINAIIPASIQPGCAVSLIVRTGGIVSNSASIPVAATGRACSDAIFGVSTDKSLQLSSQNSYVRGVLSITKDVTTLILPGSAPGVFTTDSATAQFQNIPQAVPYNASPYGGLDASAGSCLVYDTDFSGNISSFILNPGTSLDAGSAVVVTGPNGSAKLLPAQSAPNFYAYKATFTPGFIPASGGSFTFDHVPNDPESADLKGAINAKITLPAPIVWTNQASIATVDRSQPLTVTWSGGDPASHVTVSGASYISGSLQGAYFTCSAPVASGSFTVPAVVLSALPASPQIPPDSFLRVGNFLNPLMFPMTGVDLGLITGGYTFTTKLTYK